MKNNHQTKLNLKLTETKYGKFIIPIDDPTIGRSLDLYGEYCDAEIEMLKSLCESTDWFIDIGANIGYHTVAMSPHVTRVLSFEPDADNFDILGKNIAGLCAAKQNVTASRLAIGDIMGECSTKFDFGKTTLTEGNDVKMAPLDMLGLPKVNVVKIDVEGKELAVLVGMRLTIDNWKPHLLIEMQDEKTYPDTYDFLNDLGYNMYWLAVPTYNSNNHKQNTQNVFGPQHGVINWVCSAELLNTKLQPVVDRDDSIERMIYRSRKNVGND